MLVDIASRSVVRHVSLIEARQLTKCFRSAVKDPGFLGAVRHLFAAKHTKKVAVGDLDLTIEAGESVAYVGPNGAGKSTTVKMLTGSSPTAITEPHGSITIMWKMRSGRLPWERKILMLIGHPDAGQRSAIIYSIVVSCQRYGV